MIENSLIRSAAFTPNSLEFPNAWVGHLPFATWVIEQISPKIFVELGTHSGNSYFTFCQSVLETGIASKCYAVDTWQGDDHAGIYSNDIFKKVSDYHQANYAGFSRLLRMTFDDALEYFADGSIDLLHIDGLHTYDAVRHDFETWLPKLAPGAIVMLHDTNVRERNFGVWKLWEELQSNYSNNLEFLHSHGLGVLQLNNYPKDKEINWLKPNSLEKRHLINYFAALGAHQFEHFELIELKQGVTHLNQAAVERDRHALNLNQSIIDQNTQIASISQKLDQASQNILDRNKKIIDLDNEIIELDKKIVIINQIKIQNEQKIVSFENNTNILITDRDAALKNLFEIRSSFSWKLTAPLRFLLHLIRGNFDVAANIIRTIGFRIVRALPTKIRIFLFRNYGRIQSLSGVLPNSSENYAAMAAIVAQRCEATFSTMNLDPLSPPVPLAWVPIDISIVTYNSSRWISDFINSVINLDYPKNLLTLRFIDNSSTDSTLDDLRTISHSLSDVGCNVEITQRPNKGFGAGHNSAIFKGNSPFCLVTNIDMTFESKALTNVVAVALADNKQVAAWELRQKPYEHPKFYDPVTGITNWNSHACVLLRREAIEKVGGYDESLFMYGEDVELSYRLRRADYLLRYCPQAIVWHYTYDSVNQVKPIQYTGSTFANLYLRLKFGNFIDILAIPMLGVRLLLAPQAYSGSRISVLRNLSKLCVLAPKTLASRRKSVAHFPFRTWDYELGREGAFIEQHKIQNGPPLVTVITRTYRGRELYLRQALLSVAHQTYSNIEHIVIEDGGETMRDVVANINSVTGKSITFIQLDKLGRSAAGNAGLEAAKGRWCVFLDDDDLLFAEHIEILVDTLTKNPEIVAAYSLAWDVETDRTFLPKGQYSEMSHKIPTPLRQPFDFKILKHHNFMAIQSVLFERQLFQERGGFELDMDALEDWVLWKKYAMNNQFQYVPKVTSIYRTPANPEDIIPRQRAFDEAYPLALIR